MQTDRDDEDDWYKPLGIPVIIKRPYMSMTKRLLLRSRIDRKKLEERRRASIENPMCSKANGDSAKLLFPQEQEDTEMRDAGSGRSSLSPHAPTDPISHIPSHTVELKPPFRPANGAQVATEQSRPLNGFRTKDLRVQLPVKASQSTDSASNTPLIETPTSAVPQSPSVHNSASYPSLSSSTPSNLVQPSPIKKKVSLGEYLGRRKGSQPATEMPASSSPTMQQVTLKHLGSIHGEQKDGAIHGSAIVETPKEEQDLLPTGASKDPVI